MSDGSLTQDEIDALLSGVDGGTSLGGGQAAATGGGGSLSEQERKAFQSLLESVTATQSQTFSMITGKTVSVRSPVVEAVNRDQLLQTVGDEVVSVSIDFTEGVAGEHCFIMAKDTAVKLAGLMNHEQGLDQIDDMALSSLQEAISQFTGPEVTVFSEKGGVKGLLTNPPEGKFTPKALVVLPQGSFVKVTYKLDLGDGQNDQLVEVFALPVVQRFVGGAGRPAAGGRPEAAPAPQMMQQQPMYAPQMQQPAGYQMPAGLGAPSVQAVQFPNLQVQGASQEQGNIGLLMDVYMEMTVELGRTRKLIREILGMGEGTIIELDKLAGEPVDILVNHKLIAKGEVVVIDENFGVRVTEIVSPMERMSDMS